MAQRVFKDTPNRQAVRDNFNQGVYILPVDIEQYEELIDTELSDQEIEKTLDWLNAEGYTHNTDHSHLYDLYDEIGE